ncbi:hypothetical protein V8C86DRAFT_2544344 [Haematococcus lacustris]
MARRQGLDHHHHHQPCPADTQPSHLASKLGHTTLTNLARQDDAGGRSQQAATSTRAPRTASPQEKALVSGPAAGGSSTLPHPTPGSAQAVSVEVLAGPQVLPLQALALASLGLVVDLYVQGLGDCLALLPPHLKEQLLSIARRRCLLSDSVLLALADSGLSHLDVSRSHLRISGPALQQALLGMPRLQALDVSGCDGLSAADLMACAAAAPELRLLRIGGSDVCDSVAAQVVPLLLPRVEALLPAPERLADDWESLADGERTSTGPPPTPSQETQPTCSAPDPCTGASSSPPNPPCLTPTPLLRLGFLVWPGVTAEVKSLMAQHCPSVRLNPHPHMPWGDQPCPASAVAPFAQLLRLSPPAPATPAVQLARVGRRGARPGKGGRVEGEEGGSKSGSLQRHTVSVWGERPRVSCLAASAVSWQQAGACQPVLLPHPVEVPSPSVLDPAVPMDEAAALQVAPSAWAPLLHVDDDQQRAAAAASRRDQGGCGFAASDACLKGVDGPGDATAFRAGSSSAADTERRIDEDAWAYAPGRALSAFGAQQHAAAMQLAARKGRGRGAQEPLIPIAERFLQACRAAETNRRIREFRVAESGRRRMLRNSKCAATCDRWLDDDV